MRDFILSRSTTEAQAIAALPSFRTTTEAGEQWTGSIIPNATRWIQRPQYDEDGETHHAARDRSRLALHHPR
jgi:hypothetical protein